MQTMPHDGSGTLSFQTPKISAKLKHCSPPTEVPNAGGVG